jgi:hypothetical protein
MMTVPHLDIFLIESEATPLWMEAVPTFEEAERRARELVTAAHPRCLIYDQSTAKKHIVETLKHPTTPFSGGSNDG